MDENICSITIPYHIKTYTSYGASKPIEKILYSDRFRAINYHIKKYHLHKLFSLNEIINFENTKFLECNCDFVLLPKEKQRILLDESEEIYFEILLQRNKDNIREKNDSSNQTCNDNDTKKYIYILTKKGKTNIKSLNNFMTKIESEYKNEIINKTTQMVFEYKKSMKDDDETRSIVFSETPFKTNKSFDNIFFEDKYKFINFIEPFIENNEHTKNQYKKSGNVFKAVILLYGDPGCGKSSLIKATISKTGRHCILVPWTKIKTCSDFVSLFRPIKINNKVYNQNELIIVFEDFDANEDDIIKIREGFKQKKGIISTIKDDKVKNHNIKDKNDSVVEYKIIPKLEDELTLEYVLNVLDGIVELNESIVFFTTNDISIIDPALKRSGRVNYILNMKRASRNIIKEMISYNFSIPINEMNKYNKEINKIPECKIACSDISEIFNQTKSIDECLKKILQIY
jgi:SpoVK/Ycf46/Vps4 family AAA+-type ATPase